MVTSDCTQTSALLILMVCFTPLHGYTFEEPYHLTGTEYCSVQVQCTLNGTVDGSTEWKYQTDRQQKSVFIIMTDRVLDQYSARFEFDPKNHSLTIRNLTAKDSGLYTCVDGGGFGTSYYTQLTVVENVQPDKSCTSISTEDKQPSTTVIIGVGVVVGIVAVIAVGNGIIIIVVRIWRKKESPDFAQGQVSSYPDDCTRLEFLIGEAQKNGDKNGQTELFMACKEGQLDRVRSLICDGAAVNATGNDGSTPVAAAAFNGHLKIVEELIQNDADVQLSDNGGFTPLFNACRNGYFDVVKALVQKGAVVNKPNNFGFTPLFAASIHGHVDVIKYLLDVGAAVDETMADGTTILGYASLYGHGDVVHLLIDRDATIDSVDKNRFTPLHNAAQNNHLDIVKYLVESGACVNAVNICGATPLLVAAARGHLEVVQLLINSGADIRLATPSGETPVSAASLNGHLDVMELLNARQQSTCLKEPEVHCLYPSLRSSASWVNFSRT